MRLAPMLYDDFSLDPSDVVDAFIALLPPLAADDFFADAEASAEVVLPHQIGDAPVDPDIVVVRALLLIAVVERILEARCPEAASVVPMGDQMRSELGDHRDDATAQREWIVARAETARGSDRGTQWRMAAEEWRTLRDSLLSHDEIQAWCSGVQRAGWSHRRCAPH